MELNDAMEQIADIHRQMARTRIFRGYRAATTLFTGAAALAASLWQRQALPDPAGHVPQFIGLWVGIALICLIVVGWEIVVRYRRSDSTLQRELTLLAVEHFLPCIVIGALVTVVMMEFAPQTAWVLPGLWTIFFGLGLLASRRLLPGAVVFVGAFYLLCGLACLAISAGESAFSPWIMGLPFGIGQTATAAILYFTLERNREPR